MAFSEWKDQVGPTWHRQNKSSTKNTGVDQAKGMNFKETYPETGPVWLDMLSTAGLGYYSAPVSLHWTVWGSSHAPKQWAIQHLICHILIHVTTPHYNVAIPIINHPPNMNDSSYSCGYPLVN
jgi:hypothetical protein